MPEDDDKKFPSVDEEFAALSSELSRISAMTMQTAEQANGVLVAIEALRADWRKRPPRENLPEWRRVTEAAVDGAFDEVVRELQRHALQGGAKGMETALVQKYFEPVFQVLNTALQRAFVEKFKDKPAPGAPPKKIEMADVAGALFLLFGPPPKNKP